MMFPSVEELGLASPENTTWRLECSVDGKEPGVIPPAWSVIQ